MRRVANTWITVADGLREGVQRLRIITLDDGKRHGRLLSTPTYQMFRDEFSAGTPPAGNVAHAWALPLLYHIPSRNKDSTTSIPRRVCGAGDRRCRALPQEVETGEENGYRCAVRP